MTDKQLSNRRLDEAIDRAVREMMNVEPRTDLRARVLAELGGPPARVSLWPRLAFAALTLAAAVTVLTIVQRPSDHPDAPQVASSLPAPIPSPQPAPGPTRPPTGGITSPPRAGSGSPSVSPGSSRPDPPPSNRRIGVQDRPIQATSIDTLAAPAVEGAGSVERLRPIDPIGIDSLNPLGISTPDIVITPITVEQIDVTPLPPRR